MADPPTSLEAAGTGSDVIRLPGAVGGDFLEEAARIAASPQVEMPPGSMLNMELSQLAFLERVLELARDRRTPLLERARFVCIFGGSLDEFFMTRVAGFKRQIADGKQKLTLDGLTPVQQLRCIDPFVRALVARVHRTVVPEIARDLRAEGIEVVDWGDTTAAERHHLRTTYRAELEETLHPVTVAPDGPFPHVRNLRPAFLVRVYDQRAAARERILIVELPGEIPRLLPLPGGLRFVMLDQLIRSDLPRYLKVNGAVEAHLFRVTREGNLLLDEEHVEDIVEAISENVALRPYQPVVRVEVEAAMPDSTRGRLLEWLSVSPGEVVEPLTINDLHVIDGPIDLERLRAIADLPIDPLRFPPARRFDPFETGRGVFDQLRERDVLIRFPRHSFRKSFERFIHEAGSDGATEEIWVTLYRTNRSSRIVRLLRRAHQNGKAVSALVELKASFDEQRNLEWARMLESAGIRVCYGSPSLKVHAKIACVVRREGEGRTVYSYLSTGNLNAATAVAYTDLGLLTADPAIGSELHDLFRTLAGDERRAEYDRLIVAPFGMRRAILELIERETAHARAGKTARITAKLNGIADRQVIAALYEASRAGAEIDLLVRGICSLRPGVPGLSDRVRVVSRAGRYLEHSRIFRFWNGGEREYFIGSADLRGRNLSRRVEVVVPVTDPRHRARLDRILEAGLADPDAWDLRPDGCYERRRAGPGSDCPTAGSTTLARIG
jgi:polyphosphate kinase